MLEGTDITGLDHVILFGIIRSKREILAHEAIVVPLVEKSHRFLGLRLGDHTIIKAVDVVILVADRGIHEGRDDVCCSPADILADGERDHLLRILAEQGIRIVSKGYQHVLKFLGGGGSLQAQLVQPVLTDKGDDPLLLESSALHGPDSAGLGILVPVDVLIAKPCPQIRQLRLVLIQERSQIDDTAHIRIG